MVNQVLDIIHGTPLWVWVLFGYLLYRSIRGLKSRTVPLINIFIMPAIFLFLSLQNIVSRMCSCFNATVLAIYLILLLGGICAGWLIIRTMKISVDKKKHLMYMPGSIFMLVLTLLIFSIKYFFGVLKAIHPEIMSTTLAVTIYAGISGAIAGVAIGRMLHYLYLYRTAGRV